MQFELRSFADRGRIFIPYRAVQYPSTFPDMRRESFVSWR
jgi:hypothetical protein